MTSRPFLCVGDREAGAGWRYKSLMEGPEVRLRPIGELRFFDATEPAKRAAGVRAREQLAGEVVPAGASCGVTGLRRIGRPALDARAVSRLCAPVGGSVRVIARRGDRGAPSRRRDAAFAWRALLAPIYGDMLRPQRVGSPPSFPRDRRDRPPAYRVVHGRVPLDMDDEQRRMARS